MNIKNGVSLIIPVLNEEKTLPEIIERCANQAVVKQLVIVNDGSTDGTAKILDKLSKDQKLKAKTLLTVVHHLVNKGKGAAIKTGFQHVLGKYVMVQDADLEYFPEEIINLFTEAEKLKDGIVFGTRIHNRKKSYFLAVLGNVYLSLMFNILFKHKLTDAYTCYKLMPRKIWQQLKLEKSGFEIDSELISKLGVMGYKIKEVPISYNPRKYKEGKKIKWTDLLKATKVALEVRIKGYQPK